MDTSIHTRSILPNSYLPTIVLHFLHWSHVSSPGRDSSPTEFGYLQPVKTCMQKPTREEGLKVSVSLQCECDYLEKKKKYPQLINKTITANSRFSRFQGFIELLAPGG